jgi:hypothetical protein
MVATAVLLLDQVPGVVPSVKVAATPTHAFGAPPMIAGRGLTVIGVDEVQPAPTVYIIVSTPAVTPVTIPEEVPIVAWALLVLQVPPPLSTKVSIPPAAQTVEGPDMGAATPFNVIFDPLSEPYTIG